MVARYNHRKFYLGRGTKNSYTPPAKQGRQISRMQAQRMALSKALIAHDNAVDRRRVVVTLPKLKFLETPDE